MLASDVAKTQAKSKEECDRGTALPENGKSFSLEADFPMSKSETRNEELRL